MPNKKVANTKNLRRTHSSCRVQSPSVYDYRTTTVASNARRKIPGSCRTALQRGAGAK